jgi:RNA polymerase sigma-70 factor (ECF subfamily)
MFQRVARKDPAAIRECIDRFGGLVWSLARRFSATEADAEDAVQEVFLNLWKSAARYDPGVASEATFVAMIARRRLIDRNRARRRDLPSEPLGDRIEPARENEATPPDVTEEAAVAARALEQLHPEQQRVLRMSIYRGLSHEQIAQATGLPLGTVKTHIRRGLIRVREMLETSKGVST